MDGERPPLPRYGPPLSVPSVPNAPLATDAPDTDARGDERAAGAATPSRFPTTPPRPAPPTRPLARTTPGPDSGAEPRAAVVTARATPPLGIQPEPRGIPLAELAEPTEAPPPWSSPRWPTNPPSLHTSLPPSSAWVEEERDDLEYIDPLPPEARFRLPVGLVWCLGALVVAFLGRVFLYQGDWADGAMAAAVTAGLLTGVISVGAILRSLRARRSAPGPRAAMLVVLLIVAALACASDGVQGSLHRLQASFAAATGQWSQALAELDASGADPTWVARQQIAAHLAWGRAALAARDESTAVAQFAAVLSIPGVSAKERAEASAGELAAYERWIAAGGNDLTYATAIAFLDQYPAHAACDKACAADVAAAEAQAYYEYGMLLARQGYDADALTMFTAVGTRFPGSAVATRAHAAAAAVLADEVQQNENASCPTAVPFLQQLASEYADTPQGSQAVTALAAPVLVHGTITGMPNPAAAQVALILLAQVQQGNDTFAYQVRADAFGNFTFLAVAPGTYILAVAEPGWGLVTWSSSTASVEVAPLCALTLGAYAFP